MGAEARRADPVTQSQQPTDEETEPCQRFQGAVSEYLIRHKSVIDVISKFQESGARVNRAVAKAITACGCVEVNAARQQVPANISYWQLKDHMRTHLNGNLCDGCREVLEQELGRNLFYLAALCDLFGLDFGEVLDGEYRRVTALGVFNLT